MPLIEIDKGTLKLSTKLLGTASAWVWVGSGYGPTDNDDERVLATRKLMEKYYPYVPYGMWVGNREGETSTPLHDTNGYYLLNTTWWPVGVYRFNLHSSQGETSSFGTPLNPEHRDQDCSWAPLERWQHELAAFLHTEENGGGYSLRILIRPNRTIEPFGDKT